LTSANKCPGGKPTGPLSVTTNTTRLGPYCVLPHVHKPTENAEAARKEVCAQQGYSVFIEDDECEDAEENPEDEDSEEREDNEDREDDEDHDVNEDDNKHPTTPPQKTNPKNLPSGKSKSHLTVTSNTGARCTWKPTEKVQQQSKLFK
jgi:hypothetical protein